MTLTPKQLEDIQITAYRLVCRMTEQLVGDDRAPLGIRSAEVSLTVHLEPGQGKGHLTESLMVDLDTPAHVASGLTADEKRGLFRIARTPQKANDIAKPEEALVKCGFVQHVGAWLRITPLGKSALSQRAQAALRRPDNYEALSSEDQWAVDKRLGILDWDGT